MNIEVDHRAMLGPIRDQGTRPTCLAHATTDAHEVARRASERLSVEYLHWYSARGVGGASMIGTAHTLRKFGQPRDGDCPYFSTAPESSWTPDTPKQPCYRRASIGPPATAQAVWKFLDRGAVVLGISMPRSFLTPTAPWVATQGTPVIGSHALLAVGKGEHEGKPVLLVRNSWGASWGDEGHVWLTESFLAHHLRKVLVLTEELV